MGVRAGRDGAQCAVTLPSSRETPRPTLSLTVDRASRVAKSSGLEEPCLQMAATVENFFAWDAYGFT